MGNHDQPRHKEQNTKDPKLLLQINNRSSTHTRQLQQRENATTTRPNTIGEQKIRLSIR